MNRNSIGSATNSSFVHPTSHQSLLVQRTKEMKYEQLLSTNMAVLKYSSLRSTLIRWRVRARYWCGSLPRA
jgi:hypothetical protein